MQDLTNAAFVLIDAWCGKLFCQKGLSVVSVAYHSQHMSSAKEKAVTNVQSLLIMQKLFLPGYSKLNDIQRPGYATSSLVYQAGT